MVKEEIDDAEKQIASDARKWIRKNQKVLIETFANTEKYYTSKRLAAFFMAGSPGAGKTEFSKRILKTFPNTVRIDPDEIRLIIPGYKGKKSYLVQSACNLGVECLIDTCVKNKLDFLLDGMFTNFDKACENIDRCLRQNRTIQILYIYQNPNIAWDFTKKREAIEERNIPLDSFINGFILARENVQKVKDKFRDQVQLDVVLKDYNTDTFQIFADQVDIDNVLPSKYTEKELRESII